MSSKSKHRIPQQNNKDEPEVKPVHKLKSKLGRSLWIASHVAILCLGIYLIGAALVLRKRSLFNRIIYRAYFSIIATSYIASVNYYLEGESVRPAVLLAMGSVQYACLAILWIFMPTHVTRTLPFTIISLLHVLDKYAPKKAVEYSKPLSLAIGYTSLLVFFKLGLDFLRIRRGAAVSLLIYVFFYRVRFHFSSVYQECVYSIMDALDSRLSSKSTPEKIRNYWIRTKRRLENYQSANFAEQRKREEAAIKKANAAA